MAPRVVLILGSGPRIGTAVAAKFAKLGYSVAVTSRHGTGAKTPEGYLSLKADLSAPESVPAVFAAVKAEFGAAPAVVVYNAAALTPPSDQDSVLSVPPAKLTADLNVNTVSPYAAAQEALAGWAELPAGTKTSFIYTGNALNAVIPPVPVFLTLGVGKSASAYWIGLADALYSAKGSRFYYADERQPDGSLGGKDIDGPAHADFYAQLADHEGKVPWHATFVKGKGYVKF